MKSIGRNMGLIYALGLAGAMTLGCAPTKMNHSKFEARNYSTIDEAQKVLGVLPEFIEYLPRDIKLI